MWSGHWLGEAAPRISASTLSGEQFTVGGTTRLPYALLIDRHGVMRAKGLINTREHLDSLLTARDLGVGSVQEYLEVKRSPS